MKKGRCLYWLTLTLAITLALAYALHWDLYGRFVAHQEREQEAEALRLRVEALERERDKVDRRVKDLVADPLEIEAAIRSRKRLVREGEIVYRVELPSETERGKPEQAPASTPESARP